MCSTNLDTLLRGIDDSLYEPFRHKTVVITGATGLIGSLVCKAIILADRRLHLQTHLIAVVRDLEKAERILGLYRELGNLNYLVADLASDSAVVGVDKVDYIMHAAAVTQSKTMVTQPVEVIHTSLCSTKTMLELARQTDARMVYVSSMEVYGSMPEGCVADETKLGYLDLSSARSCYPESKRMCEITCNSYAAEYGVHVCSARLAQTFGAGVLPGENRAFAQFARAAIRHDDIVLRTKGLSEGNYVNSVDCVAGLLVLLTQGEPGNAYNIANEESHGTIYEVAQLASRVLGEGHSQVVVDEDPTNASGYAADVHLRLSSAKLRKLGWYPRVSLADSFRELGRDLAEQEELSER